VQDPDRTVASGPSEIRSDGSSASPLTVTARDGGGPALRWKTSSVGSQPEALQFHHIRLHGNSLAGLQSQGHMRRPQAALSLLRTGGAEGEGGKGDVSAFAFPQRRSATACIPTAETEWEVVDLRISVGGRLLEWGVAVGSHNGVCQYPQRMHSSSELRNWRSGISATRHGTSGLKSRGRPVAAAAAAAEEGTLIEGSNWCLRCVCS